ncbi:MAG: DUF459 domain-containing protein [Acidimicrobiia bacterium]|nr:DUF459 domain-containing protein [Acidimicrobiia bacterium]
MVLLMADSFIPHASRRERDRLRRVLRRRKAKLTAIAAVSVVVVALVALVSTDTLRLGGGGGRLGADASAAAPLVDDPRRPAEAAALSELDPPRRIDHDSPLRLWVGGDSLAGWLGPSLGALARETGVVATQIDYKVSSGIASDGVRNWPERAASEIEEHDPEAIVFMIGTNDASIVNHRTNEDGVYEWEPEYRSEVAEMMDLFVGGDAHRTVFWVGAPTTRTEWRDDGVVELNRVMQEEAESRDDVVFVDAYSLFAGEDGQYVDSLIGEDGEYVRVRNGDGVHFTTAGGDRLAAAVFALLDARWEILDQADPDNPIEPDYSAGSGGYVSGGANVTYGGRERLHGSRGSDHERAPYHRPLHAQYHRGRIHDHGVAEHLVPLVDDQTSVDDRTPGHHDCGDDRDYIRLRDDRGDSHHVTYGDHLRRRPLRLAARDGAAVVTAPL